MDKPNLSIFNDQQLATFTSWTVASVENALTDLEQGRFQQAALLWDAMTRDDRIGSVIQTRVLGVLGLPFTFEPGADGRRNSAIQKTALEGWPEMFPDSSAATLLKYALGLGACVGELVWDTSQTPWECTVKVWHPQFLEYRYATKTYWLQTLEGQIEIQPGDGKWIILEVGKPWAWFAGLVRQLAIPYLIRQFARRDWANYSEVHGSPIKKVFVPDDAEEGEKKKFFQDITRMARSGTVKLPRDLSGNASWDLELLEAVGNTWQGFEKLLEGVNKDIAICVLGQNLTTDVSSGSLAAATVHQRIRMDLLEADVNSLSNTIKNQMLEPWANYNYGSRDLAPSPFWDATPPEDSKLKSEVILNLSSALPSLEAAGADVNAVLEGFGIVMLPPAQQAANKAAAAKITASKMRLASGYQGANGFVSGQIYADELADHGLTLEGMNPELKAILSIVSSAQDYDEIRTVLLERYKNSSSGTFARQLEKALILADLAGRAAVLEDI